MKTQCCIIVVSIAKLKSSGVCKFNLGSLLVIMKIVIATRLQVCADSWYESYISEHLNEYIL